LPDNLMRSGGITVCGTRVILEVPIPVRPANCADLPPLAPMLEPSGRCIECAGAYEGTPTVRSARSRLAPIGEPGDPLVLTGRTLDAAGRPRSGVVVYAFQTDHTGAYPPAKPPRSTLSPTQGRARAWVRKDAQ
jgi:protocatechuate 3,4-dioxygenase beta subunit